MYYAIDQFGKKVHADNINIFNHYTCPACGEELISKCGTQRAHHFAHKQSMCDKWYHQDKSFWHKSMQSHFSPENCEIRINSDTEPGVFHIADVFIKGKDKNTIIEFQHSPISKEEFDERNNFYSYNNTQINDKGEKIPNNVIWIFDYREKRMFIDVNINTDFYKEKVSENLMCQDYLDRINILRRIQGKSNHKFEENLVTPPTIIPDKNKYVRINWKYPSRIFKNISSNVYVFFDVYQRRYIQRLYDFSLNGKVYENESLKYLCEYYENTKIHFNDIMFKFLVFVSYDEPKYIYENQNLVNHDISEHPEYIIGRCVPYEDFFKFYGTK